MYRYIAIFICTSIFCANSAQAEPTKIDDGRAKAIVKETSQGFFNALAPNFTLYSDHLHIETVAGNVHRIWNSLDEWGREQITPLQHRSVFLEGSKTQIGEVSQKPFTSIHHPGKVDAAKRTIDWNWKTGTGKLRAEFRKVRLNKNGTINFAKGQFVEGTTARISDGNHVATTITKSKDGKETTVARYVEEQFTTTNTPKIRVRDYLFKGLGKLFKRPTNQPAWNIPKEIRSRLKPGTEFSLVKETYREIHQTQPSLPKANRPPSQITRTKTYGIAFPSENEMPTQLSARAYKALRTHYGKPITRAKAVSRKR